MVSKLMVIYTIFCFCIVLPYILSQISCSPQLVTVRGKGTKVGYFWTIDPSGTCAMAVCSHLSQC